MSRRLRVPERQGQYGFVFNDPLSGQDMLGLLKMKTVDGPYDCIPGVWGMDRRCGDLYWKVKFVPEKSKGEITGYIIQESSVVKQAKTCPGNAPVSGYPYNLTFYEAFEVKNGEAVPDHWLSAGPERCTWGLKQMTGKAAFFSLSILPPSFIPNNPLCKPWTDGPCTTTKPTWFGTAAPWISNYIERTLYKWWKCCPAVTSGVGAWPLDVP